MFKKLSIYIHYPFCKSKCPYCDFNSHVSNNIDDQQFLEAYLSELEFFKKQLPNRKITTIFFGGGTPSLMPIKLVDAILNKISQLWAIDSNCEITLEANPTSFEAEKFKDLEKTGINRLSLGIQALNDADLQFLGRQHSSLEAIKTIKIAAKIFDNFSFDLIYARPNQTLQDWQQELQKAIAFGTNHLSLYQLTIEKGTPFFSQHKKGQFIMPDDNLAANFYEITNEITTKHNFKSYEISNYAKENFESKHNLCYWQSDDYLGIGAGAHSRLYLNNDSEKSAIIMLHQPQSWLKKVKENGAGIQKITKINQLELLEEIILSGLRLKKGISNEIFYKHFKKNIDQIFDYKKLETLANQKLIKLNNYSIKICANYRLLTNSIIAKICDAIYD